MADHIYSAARLRDALRLGTFPAFPSVPGDEKTVTHLQVLADGTLRVFTVRGELYVCAYAPSFRPARATPEALPPVAVSSHALHLLAANLERRAVLPETSVGLSATESELRVWSLEGNLKVTEANLAALHPAPESIPAAPVDLSEAPALPASLSLPAALLRRLSAPRGRSALHFEFCRFYGVPEAPHLLGWAVGDWAHGRVAASSIFGRAWTAEAAKILAERDSAPAMIRS